MDLEENPVDDVKPFDVDELVAGYLECGRADTLPRGRALLWHAVTTLDEILGAPCGCAPAPVGE